MSFCTTPSFWQNWYRKLCIRGHLSLWCHVKMSQWERNLNRILHIWLVTLFESQNFYDYGYSVDFIFIWTFRASREPFCGENQPLESVWIAITRRQWLVLSESVKLPVAGFRYGGRTRNKKIKKRKWNQHTTNAARDNYVTY